MNLADRADRVDRVDRADRQEADPGSLERSYDFCREIAKSRARNFYYSFIVLPPERRRAMCAVYAFMRHCDDIVDEEAGEGGEAEKKTRLKAWRETLDDAYDGGARDGPPAGGSELLPAFRDTVKRFDIPRKYFDAIIDGAEMDLTVTRYATFDDLYRYCYRVASAVGLVCIHIFGFHGKEAKRYAESCGIAFQLTNILRDVREDAEMGRVYLPREDLDAFGYSEEDLRHGVVDDRFRRLMAFQVERARNYYDEALPLLPLVRPSSRACLAAMIGIYRACLEEIPRRRYDVYSRRIGLSAWKKLSITVRALIRKRV